MNISNEYKTLKRFLLALEFYIYKSTEEFTIWKNPKKSIVYQINLSNNRKQYLNESIKRFQKLIKGNFTSEELEILLTHFYQDNKIRFNKRGREKILRINPSFEKELEREILSYLIPKKTTAVYVEYTTPIDFSKQLIVKINNSFKKKLDKEISSHIKKSK
tara:strand:- start:31 stop:513 length:483 start_codon:yes stop_codon:yes gene_type:complete